MLNKYLTDNYDRLKDVAYNITGGRNNEDLFSFVIEELYKCDKKRIEEIIKKNQMTFYVVRVMLNQYHSKTSRYHYKYRRYYEYHVSGVVDAITADNIDETTEEKKEVERKLEWVEEKLKDLYWFDAECFRIYYREGYSLSEMARETKINKNTLYKAIKNVKNYLINER